MNKYITGIAATVASLGLGGMLAGFVPDSSHAPQVWRVAVQRSAYTGLPLNREVIRPGSGMNVVRMPLRQTDLSEENFSAAASGGLLHFDDASVSILTNVGPRPVKLSGSNGGFQSLVGTDPHEGGTLLTAWENTDFSGGIAVPEKILLHAELMPQLSKGPVCRVLPTPNFSLPGDVSRQPMVLRVGRYQASVERYADKYGLDIPLVLAIIQTESGFDPNLISSRDAHGLMQVVPATAGGEVHRWLGRKGQPTSSDLLNPDVNILYGTAYLHLLKSKHLEGIRDAQSLEYCLIASYNGGSGAVLRHFGPNREAAVEAINALTPQDVLLKLTESFPAAETRSFVRKVLDSRRQYVMLAAAPSA